MTNETTTTAVETTPAAATPTKATSKKAPVKKAAGKKAAPKAAAKGTKGAKKAATKKTPTANGGRAKKDGLRKPQVRILQCLAKSSRPLTRAQIAEKAPVDLAMLNSYIGSHDDEIRAKNDQNVMLSLRTLGLIKVEQHDIDGRDTVVHTISAAGRKVLEKAKADGLI